MENWIREGLNGYEIVWRGCGCCEEMTKIENVDDDVLEDIISECIEQIVLCRNTLTLREDARRELEEEVEDNGNE